MINAEAPKNAFVDFINNELDLTGFDGRRDPRPAVASEPEIESVSGKKSLGWTVEEVEFEGKKQQAIKNNLVTFYYTGLSASEQLSWRADLPNFFVPRSDGREMKKFERFAFRELPKFVGASEKPIEAVISASKIAFNHTGIDEAKEYDFIKEGEFYNFMADFMRLPREFYPISLRVKGRRCIGFAPQAIYDLSITYHAIDPTIGELSLFLPSDGARIKPQWTEDMAKWVLSTHEKHLSLGNGELAAKELSETLTQLSTGEQTSK